MSTQKISCIILAAGMSLRMGYPKALLSWCPKTSFLEKIIREYHRLSFSSIVVGTSEFLHQKYQQKDLPNSITWVINHNPEYERFYTLQICLQQIHADYYFIQPVDNPFVNHFVLQQLIENIHPQHYLVPTFQNKGGHPILIPDNIAQYIRDFAIPNANLRDVLRQFTRRDVAMETDEILRNIDTPEVYQRYFL